MMTPALIAITDPAFADDLLQSQAEKMLAAVPPGSVGLQLRDKHRSARAVLALGEALGAVCRRHAAPLFVNDRLDIALAVGADGVHLGAGSVSVREARELLGSDAFVSVAAHRLEDVVEAAASGATAALLSPIFPSPGKSAPAGPELIDRAAPLAAAIHLYALGGVDLTNARRCKQAGAHGFAVIRAIWTADDVAAVAQGLVAAAQR